MDYLDAVDEDGQPTSIALIARRVRSYLDVVENLRAELEEHHESASDLEVRADNLKRRVEERESLRGDITDMAQTAAMKATFATTSGRGTQLRNEAVEKRKDLQQFEKDYAEDEKRLKEVMRALEGQQTRMMETRDQIARRMNIIDALLQRAEIEWPAYFFEENKRLKSSKGGEEGAGAPLVRRRGRGRRRVVRRRRAS